jgi:hypothetical protein
MATTLDALDSGDHLRKATRTARIMQLAGASARGNVGANALDRMGQDDLAQHVRLVFSEAVADHPGAERLLLPHRNPNLLDREDLVAAVEVDDLTRRVRAEPMR